MEVIVRKNNVAKAWALLSKKLREDGDLRRVIERREFKTKGEKRREANKRSKMRVAKQMREEREVD
jgi:hypothetical protein